MANVGERRGAYRGLMTKPEEKRPHEDSDIDGRMILNWILNKSFGQPWAVLK